MQITELKTNKAIRDYLSLLENEDIRIIAMDFEGEFNLHCYGEHLCLVQIYDGKREVIIDPVAHPGLTALSELFEKRDLMKIMYDSSSDASLVFHVMNSRIRTILDLRPAVSLLGYKKMGLSSILEEEFGIVFPGKKKYQQYNWMRRPVSEDALDYALNDVRELFRLKDRLLAHLTEKGLMDRYMLQNLYVQNGEIKPLDKDRYKKAKGYSKLPARRKPFFRDLFQAREEVAKAANKPPNSIFPNTRLIELAQFRNPSTFRIEASCDKRLGALHKRELADRFSEIISKHRND